MATATAIRVVGVTPVAVRRQRRAWHLLLRNRMAMIGAAIIVIWMLLAVVAPVVAPFDPIEQQVRQRLQ
jgi:peptide/nickel transport system permease protein